MDYERHKYNEMKSINLQYVKRISDRIRENGEIPNWVLIEVLLRLSKKLVFRFKLVSKQWLSLISDPSFIRTYLDQDRSSSQSQPWTFISRTMHPESCQFLVHDDHIIHSKSGTRPRYCNCVLSPSCRKVYSNDRNYCVSGVNNSLVLYHMRIGPEPAKVRGYYILNPVTGHSIALPSFTRDFFIETCGFLTRVEDYVLKSYIVVRLNALSPRDSVTFEVFFSEIGEWKNFNVSIENSIMMQTGATMLNEILHWVSHNHGIIAYDPYRSPEHMRIIAFHDDMMDRIADYTSKSVCDACDGKLRYFRNNALPGFQIWVLEDYIRGDWSLQHNIVYLDIVYETNHPFEISSMEPIFFHPFDSDVVYLGFLYFLFKYDIKTRKLEIQQKCSRVEQKCTGGKSLPRPYSYSEWCRSFLLVVPPWPISIPGSSLSGDADAINV